MTLRISMELDCLAHCYLKMTNVINEVWKGIILSFYISLKEAVQSYKKKKKAMLGFHFPDTVLILKSVSLNY